jgi:hypothetical protein
LRKTLQRRNTTLAAAVITLRTMEMILMSIDLMIADANLRKGIQGLNWGSARGHSRQKKWRTIQGIIVARGWIRSKYRSHIQGHPLAYEISPFTIIISSFTLAESLIMAAKTLSAPLMGRSLWQAPPCSSCGGFPMPASAVYLQIQPSNVCTLDKAELERTEM